MEQGVRSLGLKPMEVSEPTVLFKREAVTSLLYGPPIKQSLVVYVGGGAGGRDGLLTPRSTEESSSRTT